MYCTYIQLLLVLSQANRKDVAYLNINIRNQIHTNMATINNKMFDIKGSFGDMVFVQTKKGTSIRKRTRVTKEYMLANPDKFEKMLKRIDQFTYYAAIRRLIWQGIQPPKAHKIKWGDSNLHKRLFSRISKLTALDKHNKVGERRMLAESWNLLKGMEMNRGLQARECFTAAPTVNYVQEAGSVSIDLGDFIPKTGIYTPSGATHGRLIATLAEINTDRLLSEDEDNNSVYHFGDIFELEEESPRETVIELQFGEPTDFPVLVLFGVQYFYEDGSFMEPLNSVHGHAARIEFVGQGGSL